MSKRRNLTPQEIQHEKELKLISQGRCPKCSILVAEAPNHACMRGFYFEVIDNRNYGCGISGIVEIIVEQ